MEELLAKVKQQYVQKLPFVIYNKPDAEKLVGIFQKHADLYYTKDFTESGFIMAPFDSDQPVILLPEEESDIIVASFIQCNLTTAVIKDRVLNPATKSAHKALINKAIEAIEAGLFYKVVLSRQEVIAIPDFDLIMLFERLLNTYAAAFTYCWFHPQVGLWMGATPERLLRIKDTAFKTVALAGTQKYTDTEPIIWKNKEKEEQQLVTDFIVDQLEPLTTAMSVSAPYTIKAGSLLHLKSDIQGVLFPNFSLRQILEVLHPTPAVCGVPKMKAKVFILENEGYNRSFYSGFIGELNKNFVSRTQHTDLYVNLRCMSIKEDKATLYVGGGINKGSVSEKEWIETVNKTMVMKKIIVK